MKRTPQYFGQVSLDRLADVFKRCADEKTSADPAGWAVTNPMWGHCAVVASIVEEVFGGEILRASLEGTPFAHMRSHYWNRLPDGREVDLTESQFGGNRPALVGVPRSREEILDWEKYEETIIRYTRMKIRVIAALNGKVIIDL